MVIVAQTLFGSRARGDFTEASDVDLLVVTDDDFTRHSNVSGISLSAYPLVDLERMAAGGDLFLFHVLNEGKPLYDPVGHFERLRHRFQLRSSYVGLTRAATDLGWFLVDHHSSLPDASIVGRRVAWVVRTILIARSAERGSPLFSRKDLADMIPGGPVSDLIAAKDGNALDPATFTQLRYFLLNEAPHPGVNPGSEIRKYISLFKDTNNAVALKSYAAKPQGSDYR